MVFDQSIRQQYYCQKRRMGSARIGVNEWRPQQSHALVSSLDVLDACHVILPYKAC